MMNRFIEIFKNLRKQSYLGLNYNGKYAFVGIGNHSIHNLYPILHYLRIPLKYIVVKSLKNARRIDMHFQGIKSTIDYDAVLKDKEITGILICAHPSSHFELVKKALQHNKFVFVEKPPCSTKEELNALIEIESKSDGTCLVGLQKRYAPAIAVLKNEIGRGIKSYTYRFLTGAYPEGDTILDLFIHPLDIIAYLFGNCEIKSVQTINGKSIFIHLLHGDIIGNIELSTEYSWKNAEEYLEINTDKGIYTLQNMDSLVFEEKPGILFSIPLEKVKKSTVKINTLLSRNNFTPVIDNNQLFTSGYYNELLQFFSMVEKRKVSNISPLKDMVLTYDLLLHVKNAINK